MLKKRGFVSIGSRISAIVLIMILIFASAIGYFSYYNYRNNSIKLTGHEALQIAQSVASAINGDEFAYYDKSNKKDQYYPVIKNMMCDAKKRTGVAFIYSMTDAGTDYKYIATGDLPGDKVVTNFGHMDKKSIYGPEPATTLATGEGTTSNVYYNGPEYGYLISGFAPIINSDGKIVGVVGCDVNANDVLKMVHGYIPIVIIFTLISCILLFLLTKVIVSKLISIPLKIVTNAANKLAQGDIDVKVADKRRDEIGQLMSAFTGMVKNIEFQSEVAQKIADGDLMFEIIPKSEKDILSQSMKNVVEQLRQVVEETKMLTAAAAEGDLSVRGNTDKYKGGYKEIISGINQTLDGIVEMLNEASQVLGKMSVNDYSLKMTGNYKGQLKEQADYINEVHARLLGIENLFTKCSLGDISLLETYRKIGKRSDNDNIIPAAVSMMGSIQGLIDEANILATAAINGDLSVRGDEDKFEGSYKEVIKGMNSTIMAVLSPMEETILILQEMANKDLSDTIKGDYKGDFAKIKDTMNFTLNSLNDVLIEINASA
ncbi:MAG: HAMP domain-containing protein, partial [Ignavibacteriaceae bacterium]|nr:HAMP domain-containing protein [Ignavibacteriaceae bacterium]